MSKLRRLLATLVAVAFVPMTLLAQEPATVSGRVTNASGAPEGAVAVRIDALSVGTTTAADGTYRLVVPASRVRAGQQVRVTASRVGLAAQSRTITLSPGAAVTQNFQLTSDVLLLDEIVATGQGTASTRERLTTAVSTVRSTDITRSNEVNAVAALAGKAPGVQVTSTAGDPGAGAYIQIRGAASVAGGTQPLFVVDGTPIDNSTNASEPGAQPGASGEGGFTTGTVVPNGAMAVNPADIERVEILKGAAATAIYGARGANGVVLITTKSGKAGSTRATYSFSYGRDEVNQVHELQQRYGQGAGGVLRTNTNLTWGGLLPEGTPTYDHAREMYKDGTRMENNLTVSGGNERTTYYLGLGRNDQDGVIVGPQDFSRTSVRLKGTHFLTDQIQIGGNIAYAISEGNFVQQGSNISGIQLGALRTPPDFNNLPYRDPVTGLHRSYRCNEVQTVCPGSNQSFFDPEGNRGYDNPFFVAEELTNTVDMARSFGNISLDYTPTSWLRVSYLLGADYTSDERLALFPKSSSGQVTGALFRTSFTTEIIDSNLTATISGNFGESMVGSLTLGQNLNQESFTQNMVQGTTLISGAEETDFTVTTIGDEYKYRQRTDGYFATGEMTFADQLTLNATGRLDGSSNFGGDGERFFYPGAGASWVFTKLSAFDNVSWLDLGKIRLSYGVSGRQPPVFSNVSAFNTGFYIDGWLTNGLYTIYDGNEGVRSQFRLGNNEIKPERKTEFEAGLDLAFLDGRLNLGVTRYDRKTTDAILDIALPPSTGFTSKFDNVAEFENDGWEITLGANPLKTSNLSWQVDAQWSKNNSCVTDLAGSESVYLDGFTGSTVSLVAPGADGKCNPFGVFYGGDWVRFGRGSIVQETNPADPDGDLIDVDIDEAYGAAAGTIYVGEDGRPIFDAQDRVIGDPNANWLGSIRNTFTLFNNLTISGLIDIKNGGDVWNGTKGALYNFGTHIDTEPFHGAGQEMTYAEYSGAAVAGPGANTNTVFDEFWFRGEGGGFVGPASQFIEDGGYVKLRDVSVSYTLNQPFLKRFGFSAADITVSGRNLKTWTDYTGLDPESNLTQQSTGRGLDYFNNPQTRSWVLSVNLSR